MPEMGPVDSVCTVCTGNSPSAHTPLGAESVVAGFFLLGWLGWRTRDATTTPVTVERAIDAEMNSIIEQYVAGAEDVASLGAAAHGLGRLGDAARRLVDAMSARTRVEMRVNGSLRAVILLTQMAVLAVGVLAYRRNSIDIAGIVSNHETHRRLADWYGLPFHHFPIENDRKLEQESRLLALFEREDCDLLVLARYMQVLSDQTCRQLAGRCINIHHSFLPGFKGAKPYHQAYERGVKIIGATAHYVTPDLDEGPIIEQGVERVDHSMGPEDLIEIGHDLESVVLNRAVRWHAEHRVFDNGSRTIVLND